MENRDNNGKIIAVIALVLAVVGLSIGFAALQTRLEINGTAEVTGGKTWDVKFVDSSLKVDKVGSAQSTDPTVSATTIKDYKVTLAKPGDKVSYYFQVTNAGSFDAKLSSSFALPTPTCTGTGENAETDAANVCKHLVYNVSSTGGITSWSELPNLVIAKGESRAFTISLYYKLTATDAELPKGDVTISNLGFTMVYTQA